MTASEILVILDYNEEQAATSSIETTGRAGSAVIRLWTCFDGNPVTVSSAACVDH